MRWLHRRPLEPRTSTLERLVADLDTVTTPSDVVNWLERLLDWFRAGARGDLEARLAYRTSRLTKFLDWLDAHPEPAQTFSEALRRLLSAAPATELFCDAGIARDHGVFERVSANAVAQFLPSDADVSDLDEVAPILFSSEEDVRWLESLPPDVVARVARLASGSEWAPIRKAIRVAFADALLILAVQATGTRANISIRERLPLERLEDAPYFRLLSAAQRVREGIVHDPDGPGWRARLPELETILEQAYKILERATEEVEAHGASIHLLLRLERIEHILARLNEMVAFLQAWVNSKPEHAAGPIIGDLVRASLNVHQTRRMFRGRLQILARRIVNHAGDWGEGYIARDRRGYFKILRSAAGGGFLTVGTAILKMLTSKLSIPPAQEALLHAANFAGSFTLMHFCHFTLATKQPSMTAAALARRVSPGQRGIAELVAKTRDGFRSQFAAAVGNVGMAIPVAALVTWGYGRAADRPLIGEATAEYTVSSLNPMTTGTFPFAVLTGFLLWLASVLTGSVENWCAVHRIPERIQANRRLMRIFGRARVERLGKNLMKHVAGVGGSIFLGCLLALVPFLGDITGLPLDVRHVTLSAAALTISAVTLGPDVSWPAVAYGFFGVLVIGLCNFGVSFFLAILVALRSQGIRWRILRPVSLRLLKGLVRSPLYYFWPPRDTVASGR